MDTGAAPERASLTPQLVMGLLIIVVGVLFTLDNLGIAYAEDYLRYWPAGLIAIGLVKLWQCRGGSAGSFAGSLFVLAGLLLLADSLGVVRVSIAQLWPLVLVFFGASMVWRGVHGRPAPPSDSTATVSGIAILGGVKRGNNSRAFKGGDLTAIMGGCEIDLRQAAIDGEATIELSSRCGAASSSACPRIGRSSAASCRCSAASKTRHVRPRGRRRTAWCCGALRSWAASR